MYSPTCIRSPKLITMNYPKLVGSFIFIFFSELILAQSPQYEWAHGTHNMDVQLQTNPICKDANDNILTIGYFSGLTGDLDPGPGTFTLQSNGLEDAFVTKMDKFGNLIWAKNFGGASNDRAHGVITDQNGDIYVMGVFHGTTDLDPGVGQFMVTSEGLADGYIIKLSANGDFVWATTFGDDVHDIPRAITIDSLDNIFLTGHFTNTVDFMPGPGIYDLTSEGAQDVFVLKLDSAGSFIWVKQYSGAGDAFPFSITVDVFGDILLTGWFESSCDFDTGTSPSILTSVAQFDGFVQKLDSNGDFLWIKQIKGSYTEELRSIKTDAIGAIYICGSFEDSTDFNPGITEHYLVTDTPTSDDIFVLKLSKYG